MSQLSDLTQGAVAVVILLAILMLWLVGTGLFRVRHRQVVLGRAPRR